MYTRIKVPVLTKLAEQNGTSMSVMSGENESREAVQAMVTR